MECHAQRDRGRVGWWDAQKGTDPSTFGEQERAVGGGGIWTEPRRICQVVKGSYLLTKEAVCERGKN